MDRRGLLLCKLEGKRLRNGLRKITGITLLAQQRDMNSHDHANLEENFHVKYDYGNASIQMADAVNYCMLPEGSKSQELSYGQTAMLSTILIGNLRAFGPWHK